MSSRIRVQLIHFEYANHIHSSSSTFSMKFSPCHVLGYLNAKGQGPVPEFIYLFFRFLDSLAVSCHQDFTQPNEDQWIATIPGFAPNRQLETFPCFPMQIESQLFSR